jgi:chromosomal replication initiation ATPase DnaA
MSKHRPPIKNLMSALNERDLMEPALATAKKYHMSVEDMLGDRMFGHFTRARHEFFYHLVNTAGFTCSSAGHLLGFDHSTVYNGVKKHAARIAGKS